VAALPERDAGISRELVARALIVVLAIALIAWFVTLARDHSIASHASNSIVANPGMDAGGWRAAMSDFERAHLLDPSTDWSLTQAQYELLRDPRAALRRAENVLRHEPNNLSAWFVVLRASRDIDPPRYRAAVAAIRRLNPAPAGG
jgi:hypothetical protein